MMFFMFFAQICMKKLPLQQCFITFKKITGFQAPKQQAFAFTNTPAIVKIQVGINYDEHEPYLTVNCLLWVVLVLL
jgi:hypothetical protein